jgi:hypothetical protein
LLNAKQAGLPVPAALGRAAFVCRVRRTVPTAGENFVWQALETLLEESFRVARVVRG